MSNPFRALSTLVSVGALVFALGCAGTGGDNNCNDGIDNDGDGLIDDADPGCELNGDLEAPDPDFPECSDRIDNDGDGDTDFPADQGCDTPEDNKEYNDPVPQCKDGIDNDGDGNIDYPSDPGCFVSLDNDESDDCPSGLQCPKCANGVDDDDDGVTDYPDDPGCDRASDNDEFNADPSICGANVTLLPLPSDGIALATVEAGGSNELISTECGGGGEETVYTLNVTQPKTLVITTDFPETTLDTVIYVRSDCRMAATEVGCDDDTNGTASTLSVDVTPGVYYIIVDAHDSGSSGDYKLQVSEYLPAGAECDPAMSECAPGLLCRLLLPTSTTETCEKPECDDGEDNDSDGLTDYPDEPGCTDANDNDEADTCPGAGCPACGNGTDDDMDGLTDFSGGDPGCDSAADNNELDECIPGVPVNSLTPAGVTGTTSGAGNFVGSCDSFSNLPEDVYSYVLDRNLTSLTFSTVGSTLDTVTYVRFGVCDNSTNEIACQDPGTGGEDVIINTPAQGTYYVFVDGDFSTGSYVLNVSGVVGGGETCDPADTNFVCEPGYACDVDTCVVAACNDTMDNDTDSLTDWPNDPGCSSISDNDETDDCPSGPGCPACGNGVDDDMDGFIDMLDIGCAFAGDDDEDDCSGETDPVELITAATTNLDTTGLTNDFEPPVGCSGTSGSGADKVYVLQVPGTLTTLQVDTEGSPLDTILYIADGTCAAAPTACDDDGGSGLQSLITMTNVAPGNYMIIVDGYSGQGSVTLNVAGEIAAGATCDPAKPWFSCPAAHSCDASGATPVCAPSECADGIDNDMDGLIDLFDPGCENPEDNDETPDPMPLPECADGIDNDMDGDIDYVNGDVGCTQASDNDETNCTDSEPIVSVTTTPIMGTTAGGTNDHVPTLCATTSTAPEVVHELVIPGDLTSLDIDTVGSGYDTALYIRTPTCGTGDLACNDDWAGGIGPSEINLGATAAGRYYIMVDGFSSNSGAYTLNISGVIATGQPCDPAQITGGFLTCAVGTTCTDPGSGFVCQ